SFRCADGIVVVRYDRYGRWPQADAEDLWHGRTQPWRTWLAFVLVSAVARKLTVRCVWIEAGIRIRLALADSGGNDLPEPWPRSIADDGTRPKRHEPGFGGDDFDYYSRFHHRWPCLPDDGTQAARALGTGDGIVRCQVSGVRCQGC